MLTRNPSRLLAPARLFAFALLIGTRSTNPQNITVGSLGGSATRTVTVD